MKNGQGSYCPFCSMGCSFLARPGIPAPYVGEEETAALDYDAASSVNRGSLCGKGNMALELLLTPARLDAPRLREGDGMRPAGWDEALARVVAGLEEVRDAHGPGAIGLLVGSWLTQEEVAQAVALARVLGTPHLDAAQPEDQVVLAGLACSGARPQLVRAADEMDKMTAILAVGDVLTLAPCMAKPVLNSRYDRRRNLLGVLSARRHRTAWFAKPWLRCRPGRESAALGLLLHELLASTGVHDTPWGAEVRAGLERITPAELERLSGLRLDEVRLFVEALCAEGNSAVVVGLGFGETERPDLVSGLCAMLAEAAASRLLVLSTGANAMGVQAALQAAGYPGGASLTAAQMLEAAGTGEIKALLTIGCDPLGAYPGVAPAQAGSRLELLVHMGPLSGVTSEAAHVVLPGSTWGEKAGTARNAFGLDFALKPVLPAPGEARDEGTFLRDLAQRLRPAGTGTTGEPGPRRARRHEETLLGELEHHLRLERREEGVREVGTHLLLPEFVPSHSGEGWLSRALSWPRHEAPHPVATLAPAHAASLGVGEGEWVRLRSRDAQASLEVRILKSVPEGVVLVPPHWPEVRRLFDWRVDPVLADLDLRPARVAVERAEEVRT